MPFKDSTIDNRKLGSAIGTGECVALVQEWTHAPNTHGWKPGLQVYGNEDKIPKGTAIATFVNGQYPTDERHAAIFLSGAGNAGFRVVDQWHGQVSHERTIHFNSAGRQNDPKAYYVIEN